MNSTFSPINCPNSDGQFRQYSGCARSTGGSLRALRRTGLRSVSHSQETLQMQPRSWEVTFIRLDSPFILETSIEVKRSLTPILSRPGHLVVDVRGSTVDSTGL